MRTVIVGLALAVIVVLLILVALLVIVRTGISRQERVACLICHPTGLSAAIARRVLRMHFEAPDSTHECRHTYRGPIPVPNDRPHLPAKKGSAS